MNKVDSDPGVLSLRPDGVSYRYTVEVRVLLSIAILLQILHVNVAQQDSDDELLEGRDMV